MEMENSCMVKIIDTNDSSDFENKVNDLIDNGYKVSSSSCGYVGEVGNDVYDCHYTWRF